VAYRKLLLISVFLLALSARAQFKNANVGNLRVMVVYSDDRAVKLHARVQLMSSASNSPVAEQFTNDLGEVEFNTVDVGDYHIIVTGEGLQETDTGIFEVDGRKGSQSVFITVKKSGEDAQSAKPGTPSISIKELKVPAEAKSKYDDATRRMAKSDWVGAIKQLNQAVAIYPGYVDAYNNLAAAQARLGNWSQARQALQKAISLDDHFVHGFVNLARLEERDQNFGAAEDLFAKASALDPSNEETLTLLCRAQLLNAHYDAAIATARRVHAMPHGAFAIVHYIAARAYQHENRPSDAIAEFRTLLQEDPSGARADAVRKELAEMERKTH
jgi:Tfp pilus assembly protein PilF